MPLGTILASPVNGLLWILREIHAAAEQERASRKDAILAELAQLHGAFERGEVSEDDFDLREAALLDELDLLEGAADPADEEADPAVEREPQPDPGLEVPSR